jgi:hypothetical protein
MLDAKREDALDQIDQLLGRVEDDARHKATVAEIRRLLKRLMPQRVSAVRRRTGEETEYRLEGRGEQATLAEFRRAGQPLRVPKHVYEQLVDLLASADRPLAFDEIMMQMARTATDTPAEWQARVVLRFLMRARPEVIRRARSRYRAVAPNRFRIAAEKWWRSAAR